MSHIIGAEAAKLAGLQIDQLTKLRVGEMTLDQIERFNNLSMEERGARFGEAKEVRSRRLTRTLKRGIVLGPTTGSETIAQAKNVFPGYIDSDFVNWSLDEPDDPTGPQEMQVDELVVDGRLKVIFEGYGVLLNRLCLTQNQIKRFCTEYRGDLRTEGYATFFLTKRKKDGKFFVVYVRFGDWVRLEVSVDPLEHGYVWGAEGRHRIVLPQLVA